MNYTKNDYKILFIMLEKKYQSPFYSRTLKTIQKLIFEKDNTMLSVSKITKVIKQLVKDGYLAEGLKDGFNKTYYLTEKGLEEINRVLGIAEKE